MTELVKLLFAINRCRTVGRLGLTGILLSTLLAGCSREEIRAYKVPKEKWEPALPTTVATEAPPSPSIQWTLPAGWEEHPASGMRVGSFSVSKNGQQADLSVVPLGGMAGSQLDNVNLWRKEVGLNPISQAELASQSQQVDIGDAQGLLVNLAGTVAKDGETRALRIIAAISEHDGTTWFFKMKGDDALVQGEKSAFLQFLKSINFHAEHQPVADAAEPSSAAPVNAPRGADSSDKPSWDVPANWQEQPTPAMALASFRVTSNEGGQAIVTVTMLPGSAGGPLGNVNRWRSQVGLLPIAEGELTKLATTLDVMGGKAILVDMSGKDIKTGQPTRLMAAMVPREGNTWFYKLIGEESVVAREKQAFTKFVQTVKYLTNG